MDVALAVRQKEGEHEPDERSGVKELQRVRQYIIG